MCHSRDQVLPHCFWAAPWRWLLGAVLASLVATVAWGALPAPTTALVGENGELDPEKIPSAGLEVVTTPGGATYNQQPLALILGLADGSVVDQSQRTTVGLSTRPIRLSIPKASFEKHPGASVQIRYTVGDATSPTLSFTLVQGFAGNHAIDLSGKGLVSVLRDGVMLLPPPGPDREALSFVRQAPGATGYSSSDPSVATVDAGGRVSVLRNGQATITAQLQGLAQSYVLSVNGIHEFEIVSKSGTTWALAEQTCQGQGARLPEAVDFNDLKARYAGQMRQLELPDYPMWGGQSGLGTGTAVTFNPRSDQVSSETTDANNLRQVVCLRS